MGDIRYRIETGKNLSWTIVAEGCTQHPHPSDSPLTVISISPEGDGWAVTPNADFFTKHSSELQQGTKLLDGITTDQNGRRYQLHVELADVNRDGVVDIKLERTRGEKGKPEYSTLSRTYQGRVESNRLVSFAAPAAKPRAFLFREYEGGAGWEIRPEGSKKDPPLFLGHRTSVGEWDKEIVLDPYYFEKIRQLTAFDVELKFTPTQMRSGYQKPPVVGRFFLRPLSAGGQAVIFTRTTQEEGSEKKESVVRYQVRSLLYGEVKAASKPKQDAAGTLTPERILELQGIGRTTFENKKLMRERDLQSAQARLTNANQAIDDYRKSKPEVQGRTIRIPTGLTDEKQAALAAVQRLEGEIRDIGASLTALNAKRVVVEGSIQRRAQPRLIDYQPLPISSNHMRFMLDEAGIEQLLANKKIKQLFSDFCKKNQSGQGDDPSIDLRFLSELFVEKEYPVKLEKKGDKPKASVTVRPSKRLWGFLWNHAGIKFDLRETDNGWTAILSTGKELLTTIPVVMGPTT